MHLLKQVRPGMDLSKVVLPTFILEPRSLLEKLSDYYYHCDILEEYVIKLLDKNTERIYLVLLILQIHYFECRQLSNFISRDFIKNQKFAQTNF